MLVEDRVDVGSEPRNVEDRSAREEGDGCISADEPSLPERRQLADRNAVAGDDECPAWFAQCLVRTTIALAHGRHTIV